MLSCKLELVNGQLFGAIYHFATRMDTPTAPRAPYPVQHPTPQSPLLSDPLRTSCRTDTRTTELKYWADIPQGVAKQTLIVKTD